MKYLILTFIHILWTLYPQAKARKILDMSSAAAPTVNLQPVSSLPSPQQQQQQPSPRDSKTSRMMASSPLLSSALTSPTKQTTPPTAMTKLTVAHAPPPAISLPQTPSPIPIVPSAISRNPLPSVPLPQVPPLAAVLRQPAAAAMAAGLQKPPPPPIVAPSIRPAPPMRPQPRLKTSPPKAATAVLGATKVVTSAASTAASVIMLPSSVTATAPANKTLVTATKSLPPKEPSPAPPPLPPPPQPTRIATLPAGVNIAHVVKKANQQLGVPAAVSTGGGVGGAKENLYVIALPPEQLRNLEGSRLGSQMVTLVSGKEAASAIKSKVRARESIFS